MSYFPQILLNKKLTIIESALFWSVLWVGTGLIVWNSLDYFLPNGMHSFMFERMELTMQDWWRYTLYAHVIGGVLCIVSSLLQYSKWLLKRASVLHKYLGHVYALSIVTIVFPTGVALAMVAKGGTSGMVGFLILSVGTLGTLLLGMRAIFKRDIKAHQAWITRSFALITSAITFRTLQVVLGTFTSNPEVIYQCSLWLSIGINILLAEYYLIKQKKPKRRTKEQLT